MTMTEHAPADIQLQVLDIHKNYGEHQVLRGVSLSARAGDVISIIGSSGSGKSTFLRCMNLLERPNQGRILLKGEELGLRKQADDELQPPYRDKPIISLLFNNLQLRNRAR